MPKPPLPDEYDALLREPNPSVIGTLMPDGSPHTVATWYLWEDGRILVNMDADRARLEWMRRDPRVSLTVLKADDWSKHISLRGRVVEWADGEQGLADIDRIARHYGLADGYPFRDRGRVSAWIEVSAWHAWGF
jgi:PPOX class probable F420-dependent enzyme